MKNDEGLVNKVNLRLLSCWQPHPTFNGRVSFTIEEFLISWESINLSFN